MNKNLTNNEKAELYDSYVRQGDAIHSKINKIKSMFIGSIPDTEQKEINSMEAQIKNIERNLNLLFI